MSEQLFDDTIRIATRFANEVEPRPWELAGHMLELSKQVGALSACVLLREGYKPGGISLRKIQDETSDVLFMTFRIGHFLGFELSLPEAISDKTGGIEQSMLTLVQRTGSLVEILGNDTSAPAVQSQSREALTEMVRITARVSEYYGFRVEDVHRFELRRAEAWLDTRRRPWLRRFFPVLKKLGILLRWRALTTSQS